MPARTTIVILAAGDGTRMKSATPKVLHRIGGASLISHVLASAAAAKPARIAVVIGPGRADVAAEVRTKAPKAGIFVPQFWKDCTERSDAAFAWELELSRRLLPLPVDHRYGLADMDRLAEQVLAQLGAR